MTLLGAVMLTGCFTGIESTPKITAADVKRQQIETTPEDTYLSDISFQPPRQWQPGKLFYVTDPKINLIFSPSQTNPDPAKGTLLSFIGIEESVSLTGEKVSDIILADTAGHHYTYRVDHSRDNLLEEKYLEIPFTVEMSVVDSVRERMEGHTYYIITSSWLDSEATPRTGRRFVPVKVTGVSPGNSFSPVLLSLLDENGQPFTMFLTVGNDNRSTRRFSSIFSLTDPRLRFPDITDEIWKLITNGRVTTDMTREECRLALGQPDNVDRTPGYSILREVWTYENGIYLIFEDGRLRTFRQ